MTNRPLLVVTPTLGLSPWLSRTVSSVSAQAGLHAQHVLVAPPELLTVLGRQYPHCALVPDNLGGGVYPAINLGLANAPDPDWKWFTWINDDDEFLPGFAPHLARTLTIDGGNLNAPWVFGQVQLSNRDSDKLGRIAVTRWPSDILPLAKAGVNPFNQQGMLAPREWMDRCGPLRADLRICADVDLWLRALVRGAKFRCSPETVAIFRLRAGQISGDVAKHRAEFRAVVRSVAGTACWGSKSWVARARFRVSNAGVYAERIYRCGWKSGFDLLEQPMRNPS
jgi:hypothetical protein